MPDTRGEDYTTRLEQGSGARWKQVLDVQAPYRWNLRRYGLGRTLDVGCGIGRNLSALPPGSVGVDHNETSVASARARGLDVRTTAEWEASRTGRDELFDSLLVAHVLEHLTPQAAVGLMSTYVAALRPGGSALLICPQERGFASDPTHVTWTTVEDLRRIAVACGLRPVLSRSFPFPRALGRVFTYNEFNLLALKPA